MTRDDAVEHLESTIFELQQQSPRGDPQVEALQRVRRALEIIEELAEEARYVEQENDVTVDALDKYDRIFDSEV